MIPNKYEKLLTIAIPTYNRVEFLEECLEHVLSQIGKGDPDVEILVSDNASSDETPAIMKELCNNFPYIHYYRNETNVGADCNFLNCLKKAQGRFVHLLADDDILLPGSIDKIKECIIKNPDLKLIYLNSSSFSDQFDPNKNYSQHKYFKINHDVIYDNPNQYLEDIQEMLSFVSALVFNKESFDRIVQPEKYIGTYLLQAHLALLCICTGENAIISHVCIAARSENSGGYDLYKIFVYEWKNLLFKTGLQAGLLKSSLKKTFKKTLKKFLRSWTKRIRLTNNYSKYGINRAILFKYSWTYLNAWIYVYPYAFLPKGFLIGSKKIELFIRKIRDKHRKKY